LIIVNQVLSDCKITKKNQASEKSILKFIWPITKTYSRINYSFQEEQIEKYLVLLKAAYLN